MPDIDGMLVCGVLSARRQSRFAHPMAALSALAHRAVAAIEASVKQWHERTPHPPRARKELAIRQLEEHYARAADLHDLERMERNWSRRDGGGMRSWDVGSGQHSRPIGGDI